MERSREETDRQTDKEIDRETASKATTDKRKSAWLCWRRKDKTWGKRQWEREVEANHNMITLMFKDFKQKHLCYGTLTCVRSDTLQDDKGTDTYSCNVKRARKEWETRKGEAKSRIAPFLQVTRDDFMERNVRSHRSNDRAPEVSSRVPWQVENRKYRQGRSSRLSCFLHCCNVWCNMQQANTDSACLGLKSTVRESLKAILILRNCH
ncbi:hypothetical protein RRG08_003846 [Elysia crispata]|uniref:Uncharacterized protein n=1 Tax=Elysia crispata TaxID=231223 RepID=A0AAE0ZE29_9GAST|nr:hypothetical protein RRG08_003846 [Elysia crispata]